jgi:hypothetical protein
MSENSEESDDVFEVDVLRNWLCMECFELTDSPAEHREEIHKGKLVDIPRLDMEGDDVVAVPDNMGHFSPHQWGEDEVDEAEFQIDMCWECGMARLPNAVPAE